MSRIALLLLLILGGSSVAGAQPASETLLAQLQALPPLPKTHYSWAIPDSGLIDGNLPALIEVARITGSVCISDFTRELNAGVAFRAIRAASARRPHKPVVLGINYSPFHRVYKSSDPRDFGAAHTGELRRMRSRLSRIKAWVAAFNASDARPIRVGAVLLDSEQFKVRAKNAEWNDAILKKHNAAWRIARETFPRARIEWYARGFVRRVATEAVWAVSPYLTLRENGQAFSCSLYRVPEMIHMRQSYRLTHALAVERGVREVTPWVALAAGYRRSPEHPNGKWTRDWDYDKFYAWQLGAELNNPWYAARPERFAPWDAARVVVFYPGPFNPRTPHWTEHFVAYVRGAHHGRTIKEVAVPPEEEKNQAAAPE